MKNYIAQAYKNGTLQGYMSTSYLGISEKRYIDTFYVAAYSLEGAKVVAEHAIKCNKVDFDQIIVTEEK
jgi:hypothetical protein